MTQTNMQRAFTTSSTMLLGPGETAAGAAPKVPAEKPGTPNGEPGTVGAGVAAGAPAPLGEVGTVGAGVRAGEGGTVGAGVPAEKPGTPPGEPGAVGAGVATRVPCASSASQLASSSCTMSLATATMAWARTARMALLAGTPSASAAAQASLRRTMIHHHKPMK